jgi:glucose-6-phosphate isomerase
MTLLMNLANACQLESRIAAMFRGDRINTSEKRSVLHTATRARVDDPPVWVKGNFDSSSNAETTENAVRRMGMTRKICEKIGVVSYSLFFSRPYTI